LAAVAGLHRRGLSRRRQAHGDDAAGQQTAPSAQRPGAWPRVGEIPQLAAAQGPPRQPNLSRIWRKSAEKSIWHASCFPGGHKFRTSPQGVTTMTTVSNFARTIIGATGAMLLSIAFIGAAVGPAIPSAGQAQA